MQISIAKKNAHIGSRATGTRNHDFAYVFCYGSDLLESTSSTCRGQGFVRESHTAAPDSAPRADSTARGRELPSIDSLPPLFVNIRPSTRQKKNTPLGTVPLHSDTWPLQSRLDNTLCGRGSNMAG